MNLGKNILGLGALVFLGACGSDKGASLGLGAVLPPVRDALPANLIALSAAAPAAAALNLNNYNPFATPAQLTTMKERFFTAGPTDFLDRLKKVDARITELDTRNQETARACVSEATKEWAITGLPDSSGTFTGTFTMYFSCQEVLSTSLSVFFGIKDGFSYLAELQNDPTGATPTIGVLAKVSNDSTTAEVWQIVITSEADVAATDSRKRSSFMYVAANKTAKTFNLSVASTGEQGSGVGANTEREPFTGVGCGVRMSVNESLVYAKGVFLERDDPSLAVANNCTNNSTTAEICAGATDLDDKGALTECTAAALTTFPAAVPFMTSGTTGQTGAANLATETSGVEAGYTKGLAIISATGMPTLTEF